MKLPRVLFAVAATFFLFACKKDPAVIKSVNAQLSFMVNGFADNKIVNGDSTVYTNIYGDTYTISKFNYYISNIVLIDENGADVILPASYHLIAHADGIESFTLNGVPRGSYKGFRFLIGVDSLRNVSGAQTGDLDPARNMFWDWNTGYIFYKLEGSYTSMSGEKGDYAFHIGGFSGDHNRLQWVKIEQEFVVIGGGLTAIKLNADAGQIFHSPHALSFDDYYVNGPSEGIFTKQSQNYSDMFIFTGVQNFEL